ncbi:sacsin N-terminal ATP-binding-like domain-containing protein [Clostridium tagluense]|uniref:sacsin N-terminal ATP-binding-like domain-containing protein n=1 Tax=Clostridium tagluense TaxID=360422 RepID=UPI001CF378C3|nr:hypothetical protein [Clostridium tagluense]MCB2297946.1 hypothetical protein [Clostridium tagluense]
MSEKEEIFRKKTIDAAVNTIITKMDELYGANDLDKEIMKRRWIWELIQNANDCATLNKISIWINSNENELIFSHNGEIFTFDNLIDLITQISSKRINCDDKIGKFGTGFISTHLISETIKITGLYHQRQNSENYKIMDINIDRSGKTENEIKESIIDAIREIDKMDISENVEFAEYSDKPTTSFVYDISDKKSDVQEVIKTGCQDLDKSIPFVLVFAKKIKEIHCNGITYTISAKPSLLTEGLEIVNVLKSYDNNKMNSTMVEVLVCSDKNNQVSIATIIKYSHGQYYIESSKKIPKLFCTFPLVGTENFTFPIVLNCPKFKVLQERNQIQEGAAVNKEIIDISISLYNKMLKYVCCNKWDKLYNACYISRTEESAFQSDIGKKIQAIYKILPIVDVQKKLGLISKESLYKEVNGKLEFNIIIPHMSKQELCDELWDIINCLNIKPIPTKESYRYWLDIAPNNKVLLQTVYDELLKGTTMSKLSERLTNGFELLPWLNKLYDLWIKSTDERKFKATAIVPNQENQFVEITKVAIDNNIDNCLKEILTSLGTNIKQKLMHKDIKISEGIEINSFDNEFVANKISDYVRKQISSEASTKRSPEIQNIFNKLADWFLKNPDLGKPLFKDIYDIKHLLSSPKEMIRRLELANTVESTMNENNIELEQLRIILKESGRLLKMFEDDEITLSEDVTKLFQHISSKSLYAKEKLNYLIERSISSVYYELCTNTLYSIDSSLEEWKQNKYSTTVFKARKQDMDIRIVIRPSDDGKIIFYEDAELEALDDTAYELWTDNEKGIVRMVTLGDLIKTTGISVIPLRRIL